MDANGESALGHEMLGGCLVPDCKKSLSGGFVEDFVEGGVIEVGEGFGWVSGGRGEGQGVTVVGTLVEGWDGDGLLVVVPAEGIVQGEDVAIEGFQYGG